jgi:hypothetical protein
MTTEKSKVAVPAKKAGRKPKVGPVSLAEFRAWLGGVEEMQPAEWVPTAEQWRLIRSKIDMIVESPRPVESSPQGGRGVVPGQQTFLEQPMRTEFAGETAFAAPLMPPVQVPQSLLPGPDGKLKTPDIDTSNGSFRSFFE